MLFSATTTRKTEDLIKLALKKEPIYIGLEDQNKDGAATVTGLEQVSIFPVILAQKPTCSRTHISSQYRGKWGLSLLGSTML